MESEDGWSLFADDDRVKVLMVDEDGVLHSVMEGRRCIGFERLKMMDT